MIVCIYIYIHINIYIYTYIYVIYIYLYNMNIYIGRRLARRPRCCRYRSRRGSSVPRWGRPRCGCTPVSCRGRHSGYPSETHTTNIYDIAWSMIHVSSVCIYTTKLHIYLILIVYGRIHVSTLVRIPKIKIVSLMRQLYRALALSSKLLDKMIMLTNKDIF